MKYLVTWHCGEDMELFATEEEAKQKCKSLAEDCAESERNAASWEISIWKMTHEVVDHQNGDMLVEVA